jgi:flagellar secretion chaperone FliS
MYNAARAYLQTQVTTTKPGDVVVLLYEGAVKFLKQSKVKMAEKDVENKGILISRAMDIIAELDASLNTQKGGELGENLHKLYFYCNTRLLQANLKIDPKLVDEVIAILAGLKSAFEEINQSPPPASMNAGYPSTQSMVGQYSSSSR